MNNSIILNEFDEIVAYTNKRLKSGTSVRYGYDSTINADLKPM